MIDIIWDLDNVPLEKELTPFEETCLWHWKREISNCPQIKGISEDE